MADNRYAPPRTHVEDARTSLPDGPFIPEGRGVPPGNGWKWIADAWAFMSEQRLTFIGLFVLIVVLQIVANLVPIIGPLAVSILFPVVLGGLTLGYDAVRRGERLEVGHLFAGFQRHTGKLATLGAILLAISIVMGVVMLTIVGFSAAPFLFGGATPTGAEMTGILLPLLLSVLVVVALSLPLSMAMLYAPALIVLTDAEVVPALKTSFFACLKNIVPFLIWGVMILVFGILATIPLGLGWLLLGPVLMVSIYISYRDVFHDV